jgi:predicted histidine transporter YuiF (NhaC family)
MLPPRRTSLVQIGGGLGIAACVIGLLIFLAACMGFGAAFNLSLLPLAFGVIGLALTVIGAIAQKHHRIEDTHVLAAIFVSVFGLVGGLVEVAVWYGWRGFP